MVCELSTTTSNVEAPRNLHVQKIGCYKVEYAFRTPASNFEFCDLAYSDLIRNEFIEFIAAIKYLFPILV